MDLDAGAAIGAGLVATAVMTAVLYMLGTMMTPSTGPAYMMGVVSVLIHARIYTALDIESGLVGFGLLLGMAHWVVVGMGLGMVATMHPLMRSGQMMGPGLFVKY